MRQISYRLLPDRPWTISRTLAYILLLCVWSVLIIGTVSFGWFIVKQAFLS